MAASSFAAALDFVWQAGFDCPDDGYHTTPGDPGGGTKGGVIESTWAGAVSIGLVSGALRDASKADLAKVLRVEFWGDACDALPPGTDLMLFNGRMMSGAFPKIFQQCLGLMDTAVDGKIGPLTLALAVKAPAPFLVNALAGTHYAYLTRLGAWPIFRNGWTRRIKAAQAAALQLAGCC